MDVATFLTAWSLLRAEALAAGAPMPVQGKALPSEIRKLTRLLATEGKAGSAAVFEAVRAFLADPDFAARGWALSVFLSERDGEWKVAASRIREAAAALAA